jgi:hypothetical protein
MADTRDKQSKGPLFWAQTGIIVILLGLLLFQYAGFGNEGTISKDKLAEQVISFIKEKLAGPDLELEYAGVEEESGFYKINFTIKGNEQYPDQEEKVYVSKDGKYLFFEPIDMETFGQEEMQQPEEIEGNTEPTSNIDPEEMKSFVNCLKEKGFLIYGADWCGYTKKVIALLGGREIVDPIYIECTEQEKLCNEKEITGYPTILINGQTYQNDRTIYAFAETTGCPAPEEPENISVDVPEGECQ